MWNNDKSLQLTLLSLRIFFVLWIICVCFAYPLVTLYLDFIHMQTVFICVLRALYACLIVAFFILVYLYKLVSNIKKELIFVDVNVQYLRILSWLSLLLGIVALTTSLWHLPFLIGSVVFAFMAMLIRVIKNIFAQAILLKQENEFTI